MVAKNRVGRLRISNELFRADDLGIIQKVFAEIIPVRAEQMFHIGGVEYIALSEHFEETPPSEEPPLYEAVYDSENDKVTFKKI